MLVRHGDVQNAGKLPRQLAHGAGQPVTLLPGDGIGQALDDPGFVCADHGDDQLLLHPALLEWGCVGSVDAWRRRGARQNVHGL